MVPANNLFPQVFDTFSRELMYPSARKFFNKVNQTKGEAELLFYLIFWNNQKELKKTKYVFSKFIIKKKKTDLQPFFSAFYSRRSVPEAWTNPSPWSILFLSKRIAFHPLRKLKFCFPSYFGITEYTVFSWFLRPVFGRRSLDQTQSLVYWPRRICVRHPRWRLQCVAGHCYYHRSVFFYSLLIPVFCL